jgi:malate synthase
MRYNPDMTPKAAEKHAPVATNQLPHGFLDFFKPLHEAFEPRRQMLLLARAETLQRAHAGKMPGYLPPSEATTGDWKLQLPGWARDQRNQITGPADNAKLLIAMCNTADPGCMPDGEDSITTDWERVRAAQQNTVEAIQGTLTYTDPATGKLSTIKPSSQLMFYRPRGLHLDETRALPGQLLSGSLFDLAMVFFQTADQRRSAAKHPDQQRKLGFYFPKSESAEEAGWWSDVLAAMEAAIGIPVGTTKVMFLIESLPAAYQVEEILYAARRHVIGLNLGRWDYMASLLHFKLADAAWILPDRNTIPHDIAFFQNIRLRLVDCCHRRGALAIGGMTALFPDRADAAMNKIALDRLAIDKKNEASAGFDGAWTGHPDQHQGAISQFPEPNQMSVTHPEAPKHPDLVPAPLGVGQITVAGTRDAIRTTIEYRYGVLSGLGARLIKGYDKSGKLLGGFMEDLATDRIYRLMLAQRIRHGVVTEEGTKTTLELVTRLYDEELAKILKDQKAGPDSAQAAERYKKARQWAST